MDIIDILDNIKKEDGHFSSGDLQKVTDITGISRDELLAKYKEGKKPTTPDGSVSQWSKEQKLKFLDDNREKGGFEAFKKLVNERK